MQIQEKLAIAAALLAAVIYLGRLTVLKIRRGSTEKSSCGGGCCPGGSKQKKS
ncbi:MAG: hypothetical protein IAE94_08350 [Chthoniobacterales bacterium]|nr:hypothetical protein [Chthoniobacterales bacterium]